MFSPRALLQNTGTLAPALCILMHQCSELLLWYTLKSHVVIQCCFAERLALFVYGIHLPFMFSLLLFLSVSSFYVDRSWGIRVRPACEKSLIPACIRPSSRDVSPSPFAVLMSLCARLPLCTSKWKQVKSRLTVPGRAKPSKARAVQHRGCPDAGGSTQSVREQSFPACFFWRSVLLANAAWIVLRGDCFKRWGKKDWKHKSKLIVLSNFQRGGGKSRQSSQKPCKRKILKKGA